MEFFALLYSQLVSWFDNRNFAMLYCQLVDLFDYGMFAVLCCQLVDLFDYSFMPSCIVSWWTCLWHFCCVVLSVV